MNAMHRLTESVVITMEVCSSDLYEPADCIDDLARGVDRLDVPDLRGPFDLGAFEFDPAAADRIFSDGFQD
jgi:hypothetical protein